MTIRVALAGTGYFAQFHYDGWRRIREVDLVGAASLDPNSLRATAERFGIGRTFEDAARMLDDVRPDLLDIAAPPAAHRPLLEAAAARGIDVICQKPLGGDLETARAMVGVAEAAGITFVVHENFRFQPWHREARKLIDQGALGDLYGIGFRLRPGDGQGPDAYLARQPYFQTMERFLVHETAIHLIDVFRFLMGEVSGVYARLRRLNPAIRGEDAGLIVFDFASGAAGVFDGNRLVDHPADDTRLTMGEMWVEGSEGYLRLDGFGRLFRKPHGASERPHRYVWQDTGFAGDSVHLLQTHVVRHLRDGTPLENSGRAYLRNLEIEEAVYRSAATGARLSV
ncbi:MAG TPA: Gfo/Idh/MocA family oxidoreductase [Geminicoccaceae bacterium]